MEQWEIDNYARQIRHLEAQQRTKDASSVVNRLQDHRDRLTIMLKALHDMSDKEPDSSLQMALELAALEIGRLADRFNTELTRTSFNLSLELEE